jgi:phosphatidylserine/phosphatidylglycerophosphate/cardiolipin synthase-like enzyme
MRIGIAVLSFGLLGSCVQRNFSQNKNNSNQNGSDDRCSQGVRLSDYASLTNQTCYTKSVERVGRNAMEDRRRLHPFVPCNDALLVSMASNRHGGKQESSRHFYDFDAAKEYLTGLKVDMKSATEAMLKDPSQPVRLQNGRFDNNPVFQSSIHQAMKQVIENAQERIYLNVMLFGGTWGLEVVRLALAQAQKVDAANKANGSGKKLQIFLMHDTKNVFVFRPEMDALWEQLMMASMQGPFSENLIALPSNIEERNTSAFPFGLEQVTGPLDGFVKMNLALTGTSDHTKIVVSDPFTENALMVVQSKNITDFNHTNYDEGLMLKGPIVSLSMHAYRRDMEIALQQAQKEQPELYQANVSKVQEWLDLDARAMNPKTGLVLAGKGKAEVRIAESNADDTVRNVQHNILKLIANAQKSIYIYNLLGYDPMVAKALADASKRTVNGQKLDIRILMDATLTYGLNKVGVWMIKREMMSKPGQDNLAPDAQTLEQIPVGPQVKWRRYLDPVMQATKTNEMINVEPQQHTKSIIVDDEYLLLGSANFDYNTLKGAFREFSVVVKDPKVAKESSEIFQSIWNDEKEAMTLAQLESIKFPKESGKKPLPSVVLREAMMLVDAESSRNNPLNPRNFDNEFMLQNPWSDKCY